MVMTGGPALAQEDGVAVIDVTDFITRGEGFVDVNGDGIPDLGELAEGFAGIWDEQVGERTPEDFERLIVIRFPTSTSATPGRYSSARAADWRSHMTTPECLSTR